MVKKKKKNENIDMSGLDKWFWAEHIELIFCNWGHNCLSCSKWDLSEMAANSSV